MTLKAMSGPPSTFVSVGDRFFRYLPKDGSPEPEASAALITPNNDGVFIFAGSTFKRIPTALAFAQMAVTGFILLAILSVPIYALFWIIGGFIPRRRRPAERAMRLYPLAAVASLVAFVTIFILCGSDAITRLGNATVWSIGLFLTTVLFAVAVLMSSWSFVTASGEGVRRGVRWYSGIVSLALLIALIYLAWWGVIGVRTWV
jgi:hypothetical protein